jgi:hypothetical protein
MHPYRSLLVLDEGEDVVFIPEADRPNVFGQVEARRVEQNQGDVVVPFLRFVVIGMPNYLRRLRNEEVLLLHSQNS